MLYLYFKTDQLDKYVSDDAAQLLLVFIIEHAVLYIKALLKGMIPDQPEYLVLKELSDITRQRNEKKEKEKLAKLYIKLSRDTEAPDDTLEASNTQTVQEVCESKPVHNTATQLGVQMEKTVEPSEQEHIPTSKRTRLQPDDNLISELFERYDIDHSGTVNSSEELKQLCTNLLFKSGVRIKV